MTTVRFDLTDELTTILRRSPEELARDVRLAAAMFWYGRGELSQGRAAALAGLSRAAFLTALADAKQDVLLVDFADLQRELDRG